jgi:glycosyltransferase involved in cell wall biosynthesis
MFEMADLLKGLGHRVTIVGRHGRESKMKVTTTMPFKFCPKCKSSHPKKLTLCPKCGSSLTDQSGFTFKEGMFKKHYDIQDFAKYHPVKNISLDDILLESIPVSHPFFYFPARAEKLIYKADIVFTDAEIYVKLPERIAGIEEKQLQYVHFPPDLLKPVPQHAPRAVWCNSFFTQKYVKTIWGLDAEVVYPPIHCDLYESSNGFEDRDYDVVMLGRLHPDKYASVLPALKEFKLAVVGSAYGYEKDLPNFVTLYKDATWQEVVNVLSRSKVYVHAKGFGEYEENTKSLPEHFGQTIVEAMASGCVPVVPPVGGPMEIVGEDEQYGFWFKDTDDLTRTIKLILDDRQFWSECSRAAVKRAHVFDTSVISKRVETLLQRFTEPDRSTRVI